MKFLGRKQLDVVALDHSARFDTLDKATQDLVTALLVKQDTVSSAIQDQTMAISQILGRIEIIAGNQKLTTDALDEIKTRSERESTDHDKVGSLGEHIDRDLQQGENLRRIRVAEEIIGSLWFPSLMDREEAIEDAHRETFNWIFYETVESQSILWDSFVEWLEHGSGIYWVNGKAASGKSTLMRFIYSHPRAASFLSHWASPLPLQTARFYFWNSGTLEQRSQNGLLRAILYEVLKRNKDLLPVVFPLRWARHYLVEPFCDRDSYRNINQAGSEVWSLPELMEGFNTLATQQLHQFRLCLFIDGLDEYEGDHADIADTFCRIAKGLCLKMCVSSRPLLAFHDAFVSAPSLCLQDLTQGDIGRYVTSNFSENQHFLRLAEEEPVGAPELVANIVSRADGVFLWVKLVVKDLIRGLYNRDDLEDLQRRLELLPIDLEELFKSMLSKIEPFYLDKAAELFLVARAAHSIVRSGALANFTPIPARRLDTLTLSLATDSDRDLVIKVQPGSMTDVEENRRTQKINDQLKVRCAGLLEIGKSSTFTKRRMVHYLHRTVRDYMERPVVLKPFIDRAEKRGFEPHTTILRSLVIQLISCDESFLTESDLHDLETTALLHAHEADLLHQIPNIEALDRLDSAMVRIITQRSNLKSREGHHASRLHTGFIPIAISWDLYLYTEEKLTQRRVKVNGAGRQRPLLNYAVKDSGELKHRYRPSSRMVTLLIAHGAQPNQQFDGQTPFKYVIKKFVVTKLPEDIVEYPPETKRELSNDLRIIETMLEHGADASACFQHQGEFKTVRRLLTERLSECWPSEAPKVDAMFAKYGGSMELSLYQKWVSAD